MIVKNEEAVLERILKPMSLAADQIIIMDTGSADRTKEIALRYTNEVYDYPWEDDFAAARNAVCQKASMDYWMWLDADDTISPGTVKKLIKLKENLEPSTDVVMMKYAAGFDSLGNTAFSYYRERILKNRAGFFWQGRVHEAVVPRGNIVYSDLEIRHEKEGTGDKDRNLRIYEAMLSQGEALEPRHQFYYARELYYHQRWSDAVRAFEHFLKEPQGWSENKIDTCLHLSCCYSRLKQPKQAMNALFESFVYDAPRAELCCEIGRLKMEEEKYREAAYWYTSALSLRPDERSGAFVRKDCYGFLPAIQLCVCYDKLGEIKRAYYYHKKARRIKPEDEAVKQNQAYFSRVIEQ